MSLLQSVLLILALGSPGATRHLVQPRSPVACAAWEECRQLAAEAHEAGEYERFHDLAWRAVQTRGRRDPELFFLLARAQSLSGRPHDALVTLQRLATELRVARDISQDPDFRRVRALPGWAEAEAQIASVKEAETSEVAAAPAPEPSRPDPVAPRTTREKSKNTAAPEGGVSASATASARFEEVARFAAPRFEPGGLAYDAVSRRFVVGNLPERKLTIVAQGTNRAATLAGAAARLRGVRALEIDRRNGDLWVISGDPSEAEDRSSELHQLQLVSGRVLKVFAPDRSLGPVRFVDVAVGGNHGVMVLDAAGPRLLRREPDGRSLARLIDLPAGEATSLAPAGDGRTVYVAYTDGLVRVDLTTGAASRITAKGGIELDGFARVRWHRGTLVALQQTGGSTRLARFRLARGNGTISDAEVLDSIESAAGPVALDVLRDDVYYLIPGTPEAVIRRIRLK